jgi:hypothetical protein
VRRALRGKCFSHIGKDANGHKNAYTFCPFKSVEQHVVDEAVTFKVGMYAGWLPGDDEGASASSSSNSSNSSSDAKGKGSVAASLYSAQLYSGGDSCGPTRNRATVVVFHCDSVMSTPTLIKAAEVEVCVYRLDMSLKHWCRVEELGLAVKYEGP